MNGGGFDRAAENQAGEERDPAGTGQLRGDEKIEKRDGRENVSDSDVELGGHCCAEEDGAWDQNGAAWATDAIAV